VEDQFIGGEATRKAHPARFETPGLDVELGFGDADGQVGVEDRVAGGRGHAGAARCRWAVLSRAMSGATVADRRPRLRIRKYQGGKVRKALAVVVSISAFTGANLTMAGATSPNGMDKRELSRAGTTGTPPTVEFREGKETQVLKLVLKPGGTTGWHRHPEQGVFLVDKGTLTSYGLDGPPCEPVELAAGKALFFGPHASHSHLVRNTGAEPLEFTVLYFNLAPGQGGAVDAERPTECPADLN
jgi:quercetin dioxygenase-like cupin family protein